MIRKEIKADSTFGGNYPQDIHYENLPSKFVQVTEEQRDYIDANLDKLVYDEAQEGIWKNLRGVVDISGSGEYQAKVFQAEKKIKTAELQAQIDEIDAKRIRAIAEPQLKDAQSGQTWLEYYTLQIQAIRNQIASL